MQGFLWVEMRKTANCLEMCKVAPAALCSRRDAEDPPLASWLKLQVGSRSRPYSFWDFQGGQRTHRTYSDGDLVCVSDHVA